MNRLGFSQVKITPPVGTQLSGYTYERASAGVHDDLYVRVLALEIRRELFCLVQMDLMGVDEYFAAKVYGLVADLGVEEDHLIICTTHTHSGPKGIFDQENILDEENFGTFDQRLVSDYLQKTEKCLRRVLGCLRPLERIEVGLGRAPGIGSERHTGGEGDDRLFVLTFVREDGRKVLLYNFSCHPTILHHDNLLISADLPYGALKHLEAAYDMVMFTNGSAGDISTRFTRQETTFAEVERLGWELGRAVWDTAENPLYIGEIHRFRTRRYKVPLKFREIHSLEEAAAAFQEAAEKVEEGKRAGLPAGEMRLVESLYEGAWRDLKVARTLKKRDILELEINIFAINEWNFITIPGEIFSSLTRPLRESQRNIILGYADGYYLYFPDESAWEKRYYEASSCFLQRGEGEKLVEFIREKLKTDFRGGPIALG